MEIVSGSNVVLETYLPSVQQELANINVKLDLFIVVIILAIVYVLCKLVYKFFNIFIL